MLPLAHVLPRAHRRAHAVPRMGNGTKAGHGPRPPDCRALIPGTWARPGLRDPPSPRVPRGGMSGQSCHVPFAHHPQTSRVWGIRHGARPCSQPQHWGFPSPGINPRHGGTRRERQRSATALARSLSHENRFLGGVLLFHSIGFGPREAVNFCRNPTSMGAAGRLCLLLAVAQNTTTTTPPPNLKEPYPPLFIFQRQPQGRRRAAGTGRAAPGGHARIHRTSRERHRHATRCLRCMRTRAHVHTHTHAHVHT